MGKLIKVKTIYNGQVGFPEKYLKTGAIVQVGNMYMELNGLKPTGYSEYMQDKYGRKNYRLVYFKWEGKPMQLSLLKGKAKKEAKEREKYSKMSEQDRFYAGL